MRAALVLLALAAPALAEPLVPQFTEETATSGLAHSFTGDWEFMVGGGVAAFDCNSDARPDLFLAGGSAPAQLFRNDSHPGGALRFTPLPESGAGLDSVSGAWPLDIDGDGITDLAVLRVGEDVLLRGLGNCRFERANELWGFDGADQWSTAFAATWEPGATWPTLAVGSYIDRAEEDMPWGHCTETLLYRPGPKGFAPPVPLTPGYCALSMLFTDWNATGTRDLRISNDREYYKGGQEQLWHMGPEPRLYTEAEGWARLRIWGMGIASADLTGDGRPDYFLTSMADNKMQVLKQPGAGKPAYADVAFARNLHAQRPFTGEDWRPSTAWHPEFDDINNDGLTDLFIAKGNVWDMPDFAHDDPNNLLLQRPDGTFAEAGGAVLSFAQARGAAVEDFNADGLLDLVVNNRNAPAQLWRNAGPPGGNFVAVRPEQDGPNRDAIGGWLEIRRGDRVERREITVGGGHGGGSIGFLHVGLGTAPSVELRMIWPDGTAGAWTRLSAGSRQTLRRAP